MIYKAAVAAGVVIGGTVAWLKKDEDRTPSNIRIVSVDEANRIALQKFKKDLESIPVHPKR